MIPIFYRSLLGLVVFAFKSFSDFEVCAKMHDFSSWLKKEIEKYDMALQHYRSKLNYRYTKQREVKG